MAERNPQPLLGVGVNHVEAIRDALSWSIAGSALLDLSEQAVVDWLLEQGLKNPGPERTNDSPVSIVMAAVNHYRRQALQELWPKVDEISSSLMNPDAKTVGQDRSGAGWSKGAAFCISSAFVRVLGALEQFELDVLKALLYYRPSGNLGPPREQLDVTVQLDVATEDPDDGRYEKPPLWTWLKGRARGRTERTEIFKRVFGIDLNQHPDRKRWDKIRNTIAHGRSVDVALKEYLDVDAYVTTSMVYLATQCQDKQRLIV